MSIAVQQPGPSSQIAPVATETDGRGRFQRARAPRGTSSEAELMRRIALGDREAFASIYESHARAALGGAMRVTRNREAAEEVVQEVFVGLWGRADQYCADRGTLRAFVMGIVRNRAIDLLRRDASRVGRNTTDEGLEELHEAPDRTDLEVARREEAATLRAALGALPLGQSRVIELAYLHGFSHSEISARLGMPLGTVKSRIRLGLARLRDGLPVEVAA